ncbi:MAG: cellulase family glycosylhydrolase [Lachnospiraceae bacterium]|nr:cellulase family glycosylhydrolase [Lachnospiraceae bacterium]
MKKKIMIVLIITFILAISGVVVMLMYDKEKGNEKDNNYSQADATRHWQIVTKEPTIKPSPQETLEPTYNPVIEPSNLPTKEPTKVPTKEPTKAPTKSPSKTKKPIVFDGGEKCDQLKVVGGHLTDEKGNKIVLKGVSTHGLSWFPQYVDKKLFKELKEKWNVNTIRLAVYTDDYNGYCVGGEDNKRALKNVVKDGVKYATDLNMYVIIDWHVLNDQNPNKYKEQSIDFFKEMSKTYADYDNVIYEICNEPNGGTAWNDIKVYAEEIIKVIRNNNPNAIVIVGTPTWSQDVDIVADSPLEYDNVLYALHFYANTHGQFLRDKLQVALNKGLPIIVSEFGICDASGQGAVNVPEADKWMKMLGDNSISYCVWNMSNKGETCALIKSDVNKTNGFKQSDLTESGKWFYDYMHK